MESANRQIGQTVPPPSFDLTPSDEWFAAIDGQTVRCKNSDWHVQVFGIHNSGDRWWLQVGFDGPCHMSGTFEAGHDRPTAVLEALTDWLDTTEETPSNAPIVL
jgi:hypothetical protein